MGKSHPTEDNRKKEVKDMTGVREMSRWETHRFCESCHIHKQMLVVKNNPILCLDSFLGFLGSTHHHIRQACIPLRW